MDRRHLQRQRYVIVAALLTGCILALPSASLAAVQAGQAAPDFLLTLLNGKEISLKQFQGKPILIDFWSSS